MIAASLRLALHDILTPPFRTALWKSLGLGLVVLVGLWFLIESLFTYLAWPFLGEFLPEMPGALDNAGLVAGWAAGLLLAVVLAFLIGPISSIIAGLFLDDVAEVVERERYPEATPGRPLALVPSLFLSVKFFGVVALGNLLALGLLLVPGINLAAFFVVNGYLLGREYFEFAALRHRGEREAKAMRARNGGRVFLAGLLIAGFLAIPLVNLLTPLFAAALMIHLHQRVSAAERLAAPRPDSRAPPPDPSSVPAEAGSTAPARRSS